MARNRSFTIAGSDGRRFDPFRRLNWRWLIAEGHLNAGTTPQPWEDPAIHEAFHFQSAFANGEISERRAGLHQDWLPLRTAREIYLEGGVKRDEIEARLLAGESPETIAGKAGIAAVAVAAYERYFFNICDALHSGDWLLENALQIGEWQRPVPTEGQVWKWLALAAGAFPLDFIIAEHFGRVEPSHPDRPIFAAKARFLATDYAAGTSAKATAALATEGLELFSDAIRAELAADPHSMMRLHIDFIRLLAQFPAATRNKQSATSKKRRRSKPPKKQCNEQQPHERTRHGSPASVRNNSPSLAAR